VGQGKLFMLFSSYFYVWYLFASKGDANNRVVLSNYASLSVQLFGVLDCFLLWWYYRYASFLFSALF
jgi:hypothetical protein